MNVSPSTSGCCQIALPTEDPGPVTTWKACVGTPPSVNASHSLSAVKYPWWDGFRTTVLPATRAPPAGPPARAIGKLNGEMTAHTP